MNDTVAGRLGTTLDLNCISYWFSKIEHAGLPVPETTIVRTEVELVSLLDGDPPIGWWDFIAEIRVATDVFGYPCFLRTGQGSGKHEWAYTCYVADGGLIPQHVYRLVEWSHLVDFAGLPTDVWAVRKMIDTAPLFHAFRGMPITREFRLFVKGGSVDHIQPYWPPAAIRHPSTDDWHELLSAASVLSGAESIQLSMLALRANEAVPGFWSVDFLQDAQGQWWLTDMALGEESFWWDAGL